MAGFRYEQPFGTKTAVSHCGEVICDSRWEVGSHQHRGITEVCYLSRGHLVWEVNDDLWRQNRGDLVITLPGECHRLAERSDAQQHILFVGIQNSEIDDRVLDLLRTRRVRLLPRAHSVESIMRGLILQAVSQKPMRDMVARAYMTTLVAVISQQVTEITCGPGRTIATPNSYEIEKALRFMRDNTHRRVSLTELAGVSGLSVSHLCERFHREVGMPPAQFHQRMRLEMARSVLLQQDYSVTRVAMMYGFSSSQHFSREFRRLFDMSPREYLATHDR
jgi:AraC-like DNA-binding protein